MKRHHSIQTADDFNQQALSLFELQAEHNPLYGDYLKLIGKEVGAVSHWREIPCLPVSFFKSHEVRTGDWHPEIIFTSSGTTGQEPSRHLVRDPEAYTENFIRNFSYFYGDPAEYCFIALLPSYLERGGSSLVFMAEGLIRRSVFEESGFYSENYAELSRLMLTLRQRQVPVILLGVSYALLDFAESSPFHFPELIVMETGGMKGRRKEMIRSELHSILCNGFGVNHIHSEYGMTELFSQAYSKGEGKYECPPWMRVWLRDTNDPLSNALPEQTGGINIIDLANYDTCAFIAVQDLGRMDVEGKFEVLGRFDDSEIRGCNLMVGQLT